MSGLQFSSLPESVPEDGLRPIQAMVVDADALWRSRFRSYLKDEWEIEVVGDYEDEAQLMEAMRLHVPDLLVVDVQLPAIRAAGGLQHLGMGRLPVTIATAGDAQSLQQYAAGAVDAVLKPVPAERFQKALMVARWHIQQAKIENLTQLLRAYLLARAPSSYLRRFAVEEDGRLFFLKAEDVDWIQAAGNYIRVHAGAHSHQLRHTMDSVEALLDPHQFLRIHRSVIVNLERVLEFQLPAQGNTLVVLQSGKRLPLSRSYRGHLRRLLQQEHPSSGMPVLRKAGSSRGGSPAM